MSALTVSPIQHCQQHLQQIYGVAVEHAVDDFLITDPELARQLDGCDGHDTAEKLLIAQDGDAVDLALYLDADLVARLSEDQPVERLHGGNLVDFCTMLEGVSHFLYVVWRANQERSVTLLELELQAEIDKFIAILTLVGHPQRHTATARLHHWLFEQARFADGLDDDSHHRYRDANRYAAKYCWRLARRYRQSGRRECLFQDVRHFYRLGLQDKIQCIESTL